jgi:hypothetical protein
MKDCRGLRRRFRGGAERGRVVADDCASRFCGKVLDVLTSKSAGLVVGK